MRCWKCLPTKRDDDKLISVTIHRHACHSKRCARWSRKDLETRVVYHSARGGTGTNPCTIPTACVIVRTALCRPSGEMLSSIFFLFRQMPTLERHGYLLAAKKSKNRVKIYHTKEGKKPPLLLSKNTGKRKSANVREMGSIFRRKRKSKTFTFSNSDTGTHTHTDTRNAAPRVWWR